jgi:hypothetical protein
MSICNNLSFKSSFKLRHFAAPCIRKVTYFSPSQSVQPLCIAVVFRSLLVTNPSALLTCCLDFKGFFTAGAFTWLLFPSPPNLMICDRGTDANQIMKRCDVHMIEFYRRFGGIYFLHLQGRRERQKQRIALPLLASCLLHNLTLEKKAVCSSETSMDFSRLDCVTFQKMVLFLVFSYYYSLFSSMVYLMTFFMARIT